MSSPTTTAAPPAPTETPPDPGRDRLPLVPALVSGVAVLLAGAPVTTLVQGSSWIGLAVLAVAAVVATGLVLHRFGVAPVTAAQCFSLLVVVTALFTDDGVLGVLPGPGALGALGESVAGAGRQISAEIAPVPATPEILLLITASFGLLGVAVYLAAVSASAPAAAGVPLLAVFAVPAALSSDLLPTWTVVSAAAGFGLLLLGHDGVRAPFGVHDLRKLPAGVALIAAALVLALGVGAGAGAIGTSGRFSGSGIGGGGAIGLSPFTSLRGQLDERNPVELLRVRGLREARYIRALTLRDYVPGSGWRATRPAPGTPLPGPVQSRPDVAGKEVDVQVENVAFRDYWLPLFGEPLEVAGLPAAQWAYDQRTGTGYTIRPRDDKTWTQRALLPSPTAENLRQTGDATGTAPEYGSLTGISDEVQALAREVTAGAENNFDRAMALQDFFTGPDSAFTYSLQTAPSRGGDALTEFLTVGRTGYCEQYASAMAVMLRAVDIPSRVAVGFTAGTDFGDFRSIKTSDAHAWVEAYFPGIGWTTFDPTPLTDGRAITPEYVLEARGESAGAESADPGGDAGPGRLEADDPVETPDVPEQAPVPDIAIAAPEEGTGGWWWPPVLVAVLVAAALVPGVVRARQRRSRLAALDAGGPDAAGAGWQELLAESADRGVTDAPSDTVRGTARRLVREHRLDQDTQQAVRAVIAAIEASWYGGEHPGPGELSGPVRTVHRGIAAGSGLTLRARLLPRSVLRRRGGRGPGQRLGAGDGNRRLPELIRSAAAYGLFSGPTPARTGGGNALPSGR